MEPNEKSQRLLEAACAALHAAPNRSLNAVVLNKVLFYLDLASLRDRGETITHNAYIALQNGPVVARYQQRLINLLDEKGLARQISQWDGSKPIVLENCPAHFEFLDSDAMITISDVTGFFADATSRIASDFSHKNPGWQLAWNHYLREGNAAAVNMRIAMQQIVESDPWMQVPLSGDDEILASADNAVGDDW
ncbi:MAG: Panacea domain-containing protein [Pirellulaceae bacterium]|nr:Panacea domain-containing protein [Pirellulaceae bacterium]